MKKGWVLVLGLMLISGGLLFARGGKGSPVAFTLAASEGGAAGIGSPGFLFRLAGYAEPAGSGQVEDSYQNTAYGLYALGNLASGINQNGCYGCSNSAFGYAALHDNSSGIGNTAVGMQTLYHNTLGDRNTAIGCVALMSSIQSFDNTAIGYAALQSSSGQQNVAVGSGALFNDNLGYYNTAIGYQALYSNVSQGANLAYGNGNTACGFQALYGNTTGYANVAAGGGALEHNTTGTFNTAVGSSAGYYNKIGSHNIFLGSFVYGDPAGDANTIRIGCPYNTVGTADVPGGQNRTFIAGIVETPLTVSDTPSVVGIRSDGRLGTMASDLLPPGPKGDTGATGPAGPGLVTGSLLFLRQGITPPAGYTLLGTQNVTLNVSGSKKTTTIVVNVYQKN